MAIPWTCVFELPLPINIKSAISETSVISITTVFTDFFSRADWWYAITAFNTLLETGKSFTTEAYSGAWFEGEFWKASRNTIIVTVSVVSISLFLGTLGAYALSRSTKNYAFWILIIALVFRAMPHITLVSGYLFPFFQLQIWGILPTTIVVLIAINQPFTLWLLYSFFKTVPKELDETAYVDGYSFGRFFFKIFIPTIAAGIGITMFFCFMFSWVELLLAKTLTATIAKPIAAIMTRTSSTSGYELGLLAAAGSLTIIPGAVVIYFVRNYIAKGFAMGRV